MACNKTLYLWHLWALPIEASLSPISTYESLRCLDVAIWRFSWRQQTDKTDCFAGGIIKRHCVTLILLPLIHMSGTACSQQSTIASPSMTKRPKSWLLLRTGSTPCCLRPRWQNDLNLDYFSEQDRLLAALPSCHVLVWSDRRLSMVRSFLPLWLRKPRN